MPDKPLWYSRLAEIHAELHRWPSPWVDRPAVEALLGVGRRRAQQILAAAGAVAAGRTALVTPAQLAAHLSRAPAASVEREKARVRRFARQLVSWEARPRRLMVAAPAAVERTGLGSLPAGIQLGPGRIEITFMNAREAGEKLLALAMAAANDPDGFCELTAAPAASCTGSTGDKGSGEGREGEGREEEKRDDAGKR